jgi:hypothetical protein
VKGVPEKRVRVMVFNAFFNNISVISWSSVLLVRENGVPEENHHLSQDGIGTHSCSGDIN